MRLPLPLLPPVRKQVDVTWMLPPLAVLDKMAGGAVSRFRGATLDGARRNAALFGYAGAMFGVLPTGQHSLTIPVSALTTRLTS